MRKEKEYLLEEIADSIPQGSNLVLVNYGKMERTRRMNSVVGFQKLADAT